MSYVQFVQEEIPMDSLEELTQKVDEARRRWFQKKDALIQASMEELKAQEAYTKLFEELEKVRRAAEKKKQDESQKVDDLMEAYEEALSTCCDTACHCMEDPKIAKYFLNRRT